MADNTCIRCGKIIPEGRHVCLNCGNYDDMQTFKLDTLPVVRTNGDRIRQMTDEEFAKWLDNISGCSVCLLYNMAGECNEFRNSSICVEHKLKWLKQEVSENA